MYEKEKCCLQHQICLNLFKPYHMIFFVSQIGPMTTTNAEGVLMEATGKQTGDLCFCFNRKKRKGDIDHDLKIERRVKVFRLLLKGGK